MMEKEFIPYQEALALKEIGFDERCFGWYTWTGKDLILKNNSYVDINPTPAPTFSQAFRWFREKYKIVGIVKFGTNEFTFNIYNSDGIGLLTKESLAFNGAYEEAELACLRKLIEIVKNK